MHELIRFINAILIGYVLTLSGLILNYTEGNKVGIFFALLAFGASYFYERDQVQGTDHPKITFAMSIIAMASTTLSILIYLFS